MITSQDFLIVLDGVPVGLINEIDIKLRVNRLCVYAQLKRRVPCGDDKYKVITEEVLLVDVQRSINAVNLICETIAGGLNGEKTPTL